MVAQYMLRASHYLASGYQPTGTIINEGVDVPMGWIPSFAVDPLNTDAVNAYYANGPKDGGQYEALSLYQGGGIAPIKPVTYWQLTEYPYAS
jgi:hypothetical protein